VAREVDWYLHETGSRGAPCVVFLHGAGASGAMWRDHFARLADRFHCLAPDLPGFGRSNATAFLSRSVTADLVADLVSARAASGRAHVVGLSWGGGIAHSLLDRRPEIVERAVIDGAGVLTSRSGAPILLGVAAVAPFLHTRPVSGFFGRVIGMDEAGLADLRTADTRAFRQAFVEGFRSGVSRVAVAAPSPTLLVAGEQEHAVRAANAALAAVMPHAVARYVAGLGHGWAARRPDVHVQMVDAWLSGSDLPPELLPEPANPSAVARLRRELGVPAARSAAALAQSR
jgi:pimeloyl-ACP methyl ester carboxylesterase